MTIGTWIQERKSKIETWFRFLSTEEQANYTAVDSDIDIPDSFYNLFVEVMNSAK